MKLTLSTADLTQTINTLAKGYHEDQFWLLASRNSLVLTTDDSENRWSLSIPAKVDDPGQAYTSFKRFRAYLPREINDSNNEITLELTPKSLFLATHTVKGHLPLVDSSLFPIARTLDEATTKISKFERASFHAAVNACMPAISSVTGYRYTDGVQIVTTAFQGFCFATDRKQVIRKRFKAEGAELKFTSDAGQVSQAASQLSDTVTVMVDQGRARFKDDRFIADLSLFEENPPDVVAQFIDSAKAYPHKAEIPAAFLLEALQICDSVGGERDRFQAYLDLSPTGCRLRANGDQIDELNIDLMGTCSRAMKVYINYGNLARSLGAFNRHGLVTGTFNFRLDHERSPIVLPFSDDMEEFYVTTPLVGPQLDSND